MAVSLKEPAASVNRFQKLPIGRVSASRVTSNGKNADENEEKPDPAGWRSFLIAMFALALAFGLAIYSGAAAHTGARWVAVTIVPALARRTSVRWLRFPVSYRATREGIVYLAGILIVFVAALTTGNNLLFLVLGCMIAGIILSWILSHITLTGVELHLELPEHVFAGEPAPAVVELTNLKRMFPSFALRVMGQKTGDKSRASES